MDTRKNFSQSFLYRTRHGENGLISLPIWDDRPRTADGDDVCLRYSLDVDDGLEHQADNTVDVEDEKDNNNSFHDDYLRNDDKNNDDGVHHSLDNECRKDTKIRCIGEVEDMKPHLGGVSNRSDDGDVQGLDEEVQGDSTKGKINCDHDDLAGATKEGN